MDDVLILTALSEGYKIDSPLANLLRRAGYLPEDNGELDFSVAQEGDDTIMSLLKNDDVVHKVIFEDRNYNEDDIYQFMADGNIVL